LNNEEKAQIVSAMSSIENCDVCFAMIICVNPRDLRASCDGAMLRLCDVLRVLRVFAVKLRWLGWHATAIRGTMIR